MNEYMKPLDPKTFAPVIYMADSWNRFHTGDAYLELAMDLTWEQHAYNRKEAFIKRKDVDYRYGPGRPIRPYFPQREPRMLTQIWEDVEQVVACKFEACFINHYLDHNGHIGWHSDNSPTMDHTRPVAIVSLGATRAMCIRPIENHEIEEVVLQKDGGLLIMEAGAQHTHQHSIPRSVNAGHGRMSLVFRPLL